MSDPRKMLASGCKCAVLSCYITFCILAAGTAATRGTLPETFVAAQELLALNQLQYVVD